MLPSRIRPPRQATESAKPAPMAVKSFNAPTRGMITNTTLAAGQSALMLENFWPTPQGIEPRAGYVEVATVSGRVVSLFEHRASATFFAATAGAIYPFTAVTSGGGALVADQSGLTNGNWSTYEVQNSGGNFLLCVNGADNMRRFDGSVWLTITGTGTGAITGVATDALNFVWGHRNRVFFIQNNSTSAWYLATNAVGGTATELPLAGVFRKGGKLLMGGTWSSDSGAGMDDRCFFVTDAGEVAIYTGADPGDTNNWSLVGVYEVGIPLGRKSMIYVGGDVLFATKRGIIPLSAVVQKDPSELAASAVSAPIQPDWNEAALRIAGDWRLGKWTTIGMVFALPLGASSYVPNIFVANAESGSWSMITGWDATDMAQLGDWLYLGTASGQVCRAWTGGQDDGMPYICRCKLAFDHLSDAATTKSVSVIQAVWKTRAPLSYSLALTRDYGNSWGPAPETATQPDDGSASSEWDVAVWDVSPWAAGAGSYFITSGWRGVTGVGFAFAPTIQLMCDSVARVNCQLQRVDVGFLSGGVVT